MGKTHLTSVTKCCLLSLVCVFADIFFPSLNTSLKSLNYRFNTGEWNQMKNGWLAHIFDLLYCFNDICFLSFAETCEVVIE